MLLKVEKIGPELHRAHRPRSHPRDPRMGSGEMRLKLKTINQTRRLREQEEGVESLEMDKRGAKRIKG